MPVTLEAPGVARPTAPPPAPWGLPPWATPPLYDWPMAPQRVEGERYASAPVGGAPPPGVLESTVGDGAVGLKEVAEAERGTGVSILDAVPSPSVGVAMMMRARSGSSSVPRSGGVTKGRCR